MPPALIAAIPAIISGAGAVAGAVGNSRPRTATQTQQSSGTSTSSTSAVLTGPQRKLMRQLAQILGSQLAQGPQVSDADRNLAFGQINEDYQGANESVAHSLASRGYGDSGKIGTAIRGNSLARAKAFGTGEARLRGEADDRFNRILALTSSFIQPKSSTTTGSNTSNSTGTSTQPGQSLLGGLGGVAGDIGQLLLLQNLLGSSGGGSLPSAPNYDYGKVIPPFKP